jgi:hypothetical protein
MPRIVASPLRGRFRSGEAVASTPDELACEGCGRSTRAQGDVDMQDAAGGKGRRRLLRDRNGGDLTIALDVQLNLRDEMANQAVIGRVAR